MKIKTISATYERKLNTGLYSSMTIGASVWADLDEGDDPATGYEELWTMLREQVRGQAEPILAKLRAQKEGQG